MRPRSKQIEIRKAETHNLTGTDVDIPLGGMTTITGVSGSGKSSLAIDTLYAEGQRRFVESLSAYARQFLERAERPVFERIDFIPPAIAIGQGSKPKSARAHVGSMSQMSDLLQLLWGAHAEPVCLRGHGAIAHGDPSGARRTLVARWPGARAQIVARRFASPAEVRALVKDGYGRRLVENEPETLAADGSSIAADGESVDFLIDRLTIKDTPRLAEAMAAAFHIGRGHAQVILDSGDRVSFRESLQCAKCGFSVPDRTARLFSSASAIGACRTCEGFGRVPVLDRDKIVPDESRSLLQDAIQPFSTPKGSRFKRQYQQLARAHRLRLDVAWQDLEERERTLVWEGDETVGFSGVEGYFRRLAQKRYKMSARVQIARYRGFERCPSCDGLRLVPEVLAYEIDGRSIGAAHQLSIAALHEWIAGLDVGLSVEPLRRRILRRLEVLLDVGLGYLSLDREGRTLSAGEARRVHLSSALGAGVTGTLYVLDEPSIGLHPTDTTRLCALLARLAGHGNTVVVVEHDAELIARAQHVIELGPGAGRHGGSVIFSGAPEALRKANTPTGRALRHESPDVALAASSRYAGQTLQIRGARARTLRDLDVEIPFGALTCITGVSGSGKSTLLHRVLARGLSKAQSGVRLDPGDVREIVGGRGVTKVHVVDTAPLSRSARSIPATYLDAWTPIRKALASSPDAKRARLTPGDFSFNSKGGRCPDCQGLGSTTLDMQFLSDVQMECESCLGRRFTDRVLEAKWKGHSVHDVLALTVERADELFCEAPSIRRRLEPLIAVGLSYLTLGQSTSTLSGGEAQRLKLAAHLGKKLTGRPIFLLDEPTTGLHLLDIEHLLGAFARLLDRGATIVVVEHNLDVIRHAHHVIDLGPGGGDEGGELVASGTIFDLMDAPNSKTGAVLAEYLGTPRGRRRVRA